MTIPFKSRPVEFHQHQLFPSNIFDLDGSKFKADTSKHKAMSYARLKEKEQALCAEIDALIEQASRCDREEDQAYRDKTGYEIPEDLQFKQERLAKIQAAKQALEAREAELNPDKAIADSKPISFADTEARIMGKNGQIEYSYNGAENTFTCPGGQTLTMISESKDGSRVYQGRAGVCAECPLKRRCCQSEKGQARTISTDDKEKVAGEFSIICAAHNFKKIAKAILTGLIRPEFANNVIQSTI